MSSARKIFYPSLQACTLAGLLLSGGFAQADTFDEKRTAMSSTMATQPEAEILALLKAGLAAGKPTQAIAEARKWMRQNLPKDPALLYHAGRAAELSGDARGAAALYQQYLKKADPKSETVAQAVISGHVLLKDQLNDLSAAYAFNRGTLDRLAGNNTARQFDHWFLNEAMKRKDGVAVANRLHALIKSGMSDDLRLAHYDTYFRWLLDSSDVYTEQPGTIVSSDELVAACKQLAKAMAFDQETALRLDWAVSVRQYNLTQAGGPSNQGKKKRRKSKKNQPTPEPAGAAKPAISAAPPIAEAKALLGKYPRYAKWVQDGWAGGGNGPHYRGPVATYWSHETEAKLAPIVAAIPKLSPMQLTELMQSWRENYYGVKEVRLTDLKVVRDYLNANPKLIRSRSGAFFSEKPWNKITPAEAQKLAPQLERNPHPEASLIRAVAAGGEAKDVNKMVAALLGSEAWRISRTHEFERFADQLWHYAGRPGGNEVRDQKVKQAKDFAAKVNAAALPKNATQQQRNDLFKKLWADYRSNQPKIPGVVEQLKAILKYTPEAIPALLKDGSSEALLMARDAIAAGIISEDAQWKEIEAASRVNVSSYAPGILYLAKRHAGGSISELKKRQPKKAIPHPLEPAFRQSVANALKQNKLQSWQVIAWVNMQYSENNAEQVKLAQALVKSPQWKTISSEARYAVRQWFKNDVMTPAQIALIDAADPMLVSEDLLALIEVEGEPELNAKGKKKKGRKARKPKKNKQGEIEIDPEALKEDIALATEALQSTLDKVKKSPVHVEIPERALDNLAKLTPGVMEDAKVQDLLLQLINDWKVAPVAVDFGDQLIATTIKSPNSIQLHRLASYMWLQINRNHRNFDRVKNMMQAQIDAHPSAVSAMASAALDAFARHRGHSYFKRDVDIPLMKALRGKAAMKMGLIVIPVAKGHPAYPVYQSQGDWITGNDDTAWDLLDENWEAFMPIYRELSMPYIKWALTRVIYSREEERQEELIKALIGWAGEAGTPLSLNERVEIEIAYGDIAMQRGQIREAHEIFTRIQKNEAYQDVPMRHRAVLRRADAERIAKNFDGALQTLAQLELERVPEIWTDIRYSRALVNYDMEEFDDAKDDIDSILTREANHANAKILLGKVQLKRQKLMEATEVELGSTSKQKSIVPGEKLKVTLNDPTLAVSGAGSEIEVVVWADSGDKETFFLRQFGDQKTKFRGELQTALGAPSAGDKTLQVIGDDKIYYSYSERFRKRMNDIPEQRGGPIIVASDAIIMASARKLLTVEEQRLADMEKLIAELEEKGSKFAEQSARAQMAAESLDANARAKEEPDPEEEFQKQIAKTIKPGNPINVRVIDPDRSRTSEVDELVVSVASSSGDSIARVVLKETDTHSGWFEGQIPTTGAQAMAFAENSEPGRNPNMVISPNADYPAWRPTAQKDKAPVFTVDINDNVALGKMAITAAESGTKLNNFIVQTAMNPSAWTTVARYPNNPVAVPHPWKPSVVVMNDSDRYHNNNNRKLVEQFNEVKQHFDRGWMTQQFAQGVAENVSGISQAFDKSIPAKVKWQRNNRHHNSHVIYRFQGYFYEPENTTREFRLNLGGFKIPEKMHPSVSSKPQFVLAVNGRRITGENGRLQGKINLRAGVHSFEIWASGWDGTIGFGRDCKLFANLEGGEKLVECPDNFFDPTTFPDGVLEHRNSPAEIAASSEGTQFDVTFAPESRARLMRLVFLGQEGPVPALNKITLNSPDGKKLLPVAEDFASLNKNETLEILTGDKIFVRYVDDRFVTDKKEKHERFLDVAFSNGRVEFADMEPRFDERRGKDMPFYEKLIRFPYDQPLSVAVHDADMDVSVEPDTVKVSVASDSGGTKELVATETGPSTGIFKATITPVAGAAPGDAQIQVAADAALTAIYVDAENNRPGVPTERRGQIIHAGFQKPELQIAHATVEFKERDEATENSRSLWHIENKLTSAENAPEGGIALVHGKLAYLELKAPHVALRNSSVVKIYAQTEAGRAAAEGNAAAGFDINVPGTIEMEGRLGTERIGLEWRGLSNRENRTDWMSRNYTGGSVDWSTPNPVAYERFRIAVPLVADVLPLRGVITYEERRELQKQIETSRSASRILAQVGGGLVVRPDEKIFFGFQYKDANGEEKWLTASAKVITHPLFAIMDEDFNNRLTSVYAGETLHLQVRDLGADLTDKADVVTVLLQAKSGAKARVELYETDPHSGVFTGGYVLSYANNPGPLPEDYDVRRSGFPITYGDTVAARYTDRKGAKTPISIVTISKGADGTIQPFSKQYEDADVAMRTQFSLAESYLEIAKRHRKLGHNELATREYTQAKQLLANAMDQFRDPETRAHAEYILGNLTLEEADTTEEGELKEDRYRAALSRFMTVTGSYSGTLHASKAQFKIATIYEKLKEPDIAAQEYVKLAYKYPESEFLATSMARLGSHFLKKAAGYEAKAKPLLKKGIEQEDKDAKFEGEAMQKMAVREYLKTAQIFGRLQQRFPNNSMAGAAGLRAGQAYMRAGMLPEAITAFTRVINEETYDGKTVRSQAMYWAGKCHQDKRNEMAAYSMYKRLTYDFPESDWAAYARGQLSQDGMLRLENKLELERLEEGQ
ncbi:MAG: tetratricopeptide repeat protein [Akkermansiaceae bacterium]